MQLVRFLLGVLFGALHCAFANCAETPPTSDGHHCWRFHIAGVVPGVTVGSQVDRLLGNGLGHGHELGYTRLFVDSRLKATLHLEMDYDRVVNEITLIAGVIPGLTTKQIEKAKTKYFYPSEGFGLFHELKLGSSFAEVELNLGQPTNRESEDSWQYKLECNYILPNYLYLTFKNGRVVKAQFSAPKE